MQPAKHLALFFHIWPTVVVVVIMIAIVVVVVAIAAIAGHLHYICALPAAR